MAQLVERSLPILGVCGSNPVIGKSANCIEKTKINQNRPGMANFFQKR